MKPQDRSTTGRQGFYANLPAVTKFEELTDPAIYEPLPEGWLIGLSDVVQSTVAIEVGRYKAVNIAGAAVIAALSNALGSSSEFPFSFAGDGASFAVPPEHEAVAREALSATAAWVRDDLGLHLRTALLPVELIRTGGRRRAVITSILSTVLWAGTLLPLRR